MKDNYAWVRLYLYDAWRFTCETFKPKDDGDCPRSKNARVEPFHCQPVGKSLDQFSR